MLVLCTRVWIISESVRGQYMLFLQQNRRLLGGSRPLFGGNRTVSKQTKHGAIYIRGSRCLFGDIRYLLGCSRCLLVDIRCLLGGSSCLSGDKALIKIDSC